MLLELQPGVLYGPIDSRRYGRSLGINLSPSHDKLCSFNCVYCHYGVTARCTTDPAVYAKTCPDADEVISCVEQMIRSDEQFDVITFSGNGEATLHPAFSEIVSEVVRLRDRHRPRVRVALLSNATGLTNEAVRAALSKIDLPVLKLDAGRRSDFRAVNRPVKDVDFAAIVEFLTELEKVLLQTVFVDGSPSNVTQPALEAYFAVVSRIRPQEIHAYSIDRPVPNQRIKLVTPKHLLKIADELLQQTGVPMKTFCARESA